MGDKGDRKMIEVEAGKIIEQPQGKILRIKKGQEGVDFHGILAQFCQYADIAHSFLHVDKLKQYVVQVPLQYQKAFDAGTYFINQNKKTGVMWPALMEVKEDGRWGFIDNLPIKEQELIHGNPMHDIATNFYNLALQKQIASLAEKVEQTYKIVERIEHGQMDDRIAGLYSGREQIQHAMLLEDPQDKKQAIALGRQSLTDAKYQLGLTLKRRIEEFEPIPDSTFRQLNLAFRQKGVFDRRDDEIDEIQNYYALFLDATQLLAASYIVTGDIEAATQTYKDSIEFVSTIDFSNVQTIRHIHKQKEIKDLFVFHPITDINAEKKKLDAAAKEYDYLLIEASGNELLEVLGNVGRIQESKTE